MVVLFMKLVSINMDDQKLKNKAGMLKKSDVMANVILVVFICGFYIGLVRYI